MLRGTWVVLVVMLAVTGCGQDVLTGHSVLVDDTGRDDTPDGGGWILVLPAGRAPDLWSAVGEKPDDLRHASVTVDEAVADNVGGTLVEVSDVGDWSLTVTGPTLLCRVPAEGSTVGCARVDLPETGTVRTEQGEGGLSVSVE